MSSCAVKSPSIEELFGAPFKDYTIFAKDGREIQVHKMMLWTRCRMFKSLFNRTEMKQEDFMQTTHNYDALLSVVKWMYGSEIHLTNDIYEIADHFDIPELLDWKSYITINNKYVHRFIDLENGKITLDLVEERNYTEIYNSVISAIAKTCYKYDGSITCETIYTHIRIKRGLLNAKDRILHTAPIRMLKSWITSRDRINDEDDVLYALKTYIAYNPTTKDIVERELMSLINTDLTNIHHGRFVSYSDVANGIAITK